MPRNVEIKARVRDFEALRLKVEALSDTPVEIIDQLDTFYIAPKGRLKLRVLAPDRCELIPYTRTDDSTAKQSSYNIVRSDDPASFSRILESVLPIRGVVTKRRHLYLIGQTRVHLDDVEGLGMFMELEVVLSKGQSTKYGAEIAEDLMTKLDVQTEDLISGAYIDLLEKGT